MQTLRTCTNGDRSSYLELKKIYTNMNKNIDQERRSKLPEEPRQYIDLDKIVNIKKDRKIYLEKDKT